MGVTIRNDFLKRINSRTLDNKFPVKRVGGVITVNPNNFYTSAEIEALYPSYSKYYIDWVAGSDTTGNGTYALPYKTLAKALSVAASGDIISYILSDFTEETYSPPLNPNVGNIIVAGYNKRVQIRNSFVCVNNPHYSYNLDFCAYYSNTNYQVEDCYSCSFFITQNAYTFQSLTIGSCKHCYIPDSYKILQIHKAKWKVEIEYSFLGRIFEPESHDTFYRCHLVGDITLAQNYQLEYCSVIGNISLDGKRLSTLLLDGSINGELSLIAKLIESDFGFDDNLDNYFETFSPREVTYTLSDTKNAYNEFFETYERKEKLKTVNRVGYQSNNNSEIALFNSINTDLEIALSLTHKEWMQGNYQNKLKSGLIAVSDFIERDLLSVTYQDGNLVQFNNQDAEDYSLCGYVVKIGENWFYIDSMASHISTNGELIYCYYIRSINSTSINIPEILVSLNPIMTANDEPEGYLASAYRIFDADRQAYMAFTSEGNPLRLYQDGYVQLEFPSAVTISAYGFGLTSATWKLYGSNDGINFDLLDSQSINSESFRNWVFHLSSLKKYSIFRLCDFSGITQIQELKFYNTAVDIYRLFHLSDVSSGYELHNNSKYTLLFAERKVSPYDLNIYLEGE